MKPTAATWIRRVSILLCAGVVWGCTDRQNPLEPKVAPSGARHDVVAPGSAGALILGTTVSGGTNSIEARTAAALGLPVNVVSPSEWSALTADDFASYRVIILGDPFCATGTSLVSAAVANASVWGSVVSGNIFIIGTDPVLHGKTEVTQNGIAFAAAATGKTGAYIALSCYYAFASIGTAVPLLSGLSSRGAFKVEGQVDCPNNVHKVADHPALAGLTDSYLSNWGCSEHEGFDEIPSDFEVLAIVRGSRNIFTAADGSVGLPYIVGRGELNILSDIHLTGPATTEINQSVTVTAALSGDGVPPGAQVTFTVVDGPHAGVTGLVTSDASGNAVFTYSATTEGTDGIRATFVDTRGRTQTSNRLEVAWTKPSDVTPPEIVPAISGTAGTDGWYTSPVHVSWAVTETQSTIASKNGCDDASISNETPGTVLTCTATNSVGLTGTQSVTIKMDQTPPEIASDVAGTAGSNGWYVSNVSVSWGVSDAISGIATSSGCAPLVQSTDGIASFTCSATDGAGLSNARSVTVKRDATPPDISFSAHPATYTVDAFVDIGCSASDAVSQLASNGCVNVSGNAYTFGLGSHSYSATAVDNAGNSSVATTSFTVIVTTTSLENLTLRLIGTAPMADAFQAKLDAATAALQSGNTTAAHNMINAYINEIQAQAGKAITQATANLLIALARAL